MAVLSGCPDVRMGDYATGLATDLIYGHMKRECHQSGRGMPTFHLWSFEIGMPSRSSVASHPFIGSGSDIYTSGQRCGSCSTHKGQAEASEASRSPILSDSLWVVAWNRLLGLEFRGAVPMAVHVDRDLIERGWP